MRTLFASLLLFTACSHTQNNRSPQSLRPLADYFGERPVEFVGMGTVWKVYTQRPEGKSVSKAVLAENLSREVQQLDLIFSDWNEQSELRRLEKRGLTKKHKASPEFIKGLKWAQKFHEMTEGSFDITVGAVLWKVSSEAAGQSHLEVGEKSFHFKKDPKRLSFGGYIKGAAVGRLAQELLRSGFETFRVDGGGGNLIERSPAGELTVIARSNSHQEKNQHIVDPRNPKTSLNRSVEVSCHYQEKSQDWAFESAKIDALTKALLIRPELTVLPQNCEAKFNNKQAQLQES